MIEEVTMYETRDGALFREAKEAEAHITDNICAELNEIIKMARRSLTMNLLDYGLNDNLLALS